MLSKLYEYQNLRVKYLQLKEALGKKDKREELLKWKKHIEDLNGERENLKKSAALITKELKKTTDTIKDLREKAEVVEEQMYNGKITNPKELMSLQKKLEEINQHLDESKNHLANLTKELEKHNQVIDEKKVELSVEIKSYQTETKKYKQLREIDKANLEKMFEQLKNLEKEIDQKLLEKYKRNSKRIGSNVIVPLKGEKCSGCYIDISKVMLADIKKGNTLVNCENCGRILFIK